MNKCAVIEFHEEEAAGTHNVSAVVAHEKMIRWVSDNHIDIIQRNVTFDDYKEECLKRRIPYCPEDIFNEEFNLNYHTL